MYKDLVILIPGILGSALSKDGAEIWGVSASAIARGMSSRAGSFDALRLAGDDPDVDDSGDGIVATRLLPDVQLVPGLWKIDGYGAVRDTLCEKLDLRPGRNFFDFPYDWRRDVRVAARALERKSQVWLRQWRDWSGNEEASLVLIAHSMGGLVARHFVEVLGGWQRTAVLATFGTPFRGSPKALGALSNGLEASVGGFRVFDLTEVVRSLTSVHQLLPIYKVYDAGNGQRIRLSETSQIPNLSKDRVASAMRFHQDVEEAQATNATTPGYLDRYSILPMVGVEQPTDCFARAGVSGIELLRRVPKENHKGDGTVPRFSAMPPEWTRERGATFFADAHACLQNGTAALTHLCAVLQGAGTDLARLRAGEEALTPLGLDVADAHASERPVTIRATSQRYLPYLDAAVRETDTGVAYGRRLWPDGDGYGGRVDLPSGSYRVTVAAPGARPVTDIFVVGESGARPRADAAPETR
ncbi:hypothetical protein MKK55_19095 [Methylobacterium sp. J-059]|uniref:esterase/lipase family protein n=1 Tax=Methylobacterium sp. J-059 TaxID=2836643 RepID=UPI001FBBD40C|nr:hypothetical protein [Methylobacterium sp. J-059]MCJ2041039.1 hypothetical protein [Methylobacterium sp. J-059]